MKKLRPLLLREKMHIGQQELADYLGISRPLLSLYEKAERNLPTPALLKIANLEKLYTEFQETKSNKTAKQQPVIREHHDKTKKSMQAHISKLAYKKKGLTIQLNKMAAGHAGVLAFLSILDKLEQTTPKTKETMLDHKWISIQKDEALEQAIRCGDASQLKLQAKIESMDAEVGIYERIHKKI